MSEDACSCEDPDLVLVKDRNMALPYVSGNPYSRYCRGCSRRYFCKGTLWERAKDKFVIPNNDDEPIPVEDYEDENYFECPKCEHPMFGYPDSCEECGEEYDWGDAKPDDS